jgi:hypothetical protein
VTPEALAAFAARPENQGVAVQHAVQILLVHLERTGQP